MSDLENKKVLIVDDEELIRVLFEEELHAINVKTSVAEDGEIALNMLRSERFDLVITDFQMPKCDGIMLAQKIQEQLQDKPIIIMCTGYAKNFNEEAAVGAGIAHIVEKPFDLTVLMQLVEEILKNGL